MKPLLHRLAGRRAFASGLPTAATLLLLAALPATAQTSTPYTGTGWVIGVPVLPVVCTNGAGQVLLRANVQTLRVDGTDARFPGRRSVFTDGAYQADGSALIYGTCYHEVGTWDATGTNFTATGGIWEINWRGVMQTDYSLQLSLAGYGSGGSIDGLRMAETATRAAASAPIDPTVPLLYTGTIKPPPVNASEIVDNFDDNLFTGTLWGMGTVTESNQQFIARGSFAGVHTTSIQDSWVGGKLKPNTTWIVPDGMTKEWRADLVSLDENATNAAILLVGNEGVGGYNFMKGRDFASLNKWSSDLRISMLACEKVALRNTNVVLALALTRVNPNLVITIRVLDKADPNTVLYQHSVVDSPSADPTLTTAQFQALTGMRWLDLPRRQGSALHLIRRGLRRVPIHGRRTAGANRHLRQPRTADVGGPWYRHRASRAPGLARVSYDQLRRRRGTHRARPVAAGPRVAHARDAAGDCPDQRGGQVLPPAAGTVRRLRHREGCEDHAAGIWYCLGAFLRVLRFFVVHGSREHDVQHSLTVVCTRIRVTLAVRGPGVILKLEWGIDPTPSNGQPILASVIGSTSRQTLWRR